MIILDTYMLLVGWEHRAPRLHLRIRVGASISRESFSGFRLVRSKACQVLLKLTTVPSTRLAQSLRYSVSVKRQGLRAHVAQRTDREHQPGDHFVVQFRRSRPRRIAHYQIPFLNLPPAASVTFLAASNRDGLLIFFKPCSVVHNIQFSSWPLPIQQSAASPACAIRHKAYGK
jgi:hypothetical protein